MNVGFLLKVGLEFIPVHSPIAKQFGQFPLFESTKVSEQCKGFDSFLMHDDVKFSQNLNSCSHSGKNFVISNF